MNIYGKTSIPDQFFTNSKEDKKAFMDLLSKGGFRGDKDEAWKAYAKKQVEKPVEKKKKKGGSSVADSEKGSKAE